MKIRASNYKDALEVRELIALKLSRVADLFGQISALVEDEGEYDFCDKFAFYAGLSSAVRASSLSFSESDGARVLLP